MATKPSPYLGHPNQVRKIEWVYKDKIVTFKVDGSLNLFFIISEILIEGLYTPPDLPVEIRTGDRVVDVGANIGVFQFFPPSQGLKSFGLRAG